MHGVDGFDPCESGGMFQEALQAKEDEERLKEMMRAEEMRAVPTFYEEPEEEEPTQEEADDAMDDEVQTPQERYGSGEDRKEMRRLTPSKNRKPPPAGKRAKNPNYKPKEQPKPQPVPEDMEDDKKESKCTIQ